MKKRRDLIELFSTFLQIDDHYDALGPSWVKSPRLANNMLRKIEAEPDGKEEFWAQYWLREVIQTSPTPLVAKEHLSAYLEEACYWTVIKIHQQLSTYNLRRVDCFLMAREAVANPVKLFKNYDYKSSSVKTYCQFPLRSAILDQVRKGRELDKYTWPALLRAITKKRLKEALSQANIKEPSFSQCVLAWQCFVAEYVPDKVKGSKQLQPPNQKQLEGIATYYNQQKNSENPVVSGQDIQSLLDSCVQAIQNNSKVSFVALEDCLSEPALSSENPLDEQESEESESHAVNTVLEQAFTTLPEPAQVLLKLWYGLGINQSDLALALGIQKQYQVSRQVGKHKQFLLTALAEWSKKTLQITLNSQQLNEMGKQLDEWLEEHSSTPFRQVLKAALLQSNLNGEIQILNRLFGQNLKIKEVADELQISEVSVNQRLTQTKQVLQDSLNFYVENHLKVSLNSCKSSNRSIAQFVEIYLQRAPYATF